MAVLGTFLQMDPFFLPCTGVCSLGADPETGITLGAALYSRNTPVSGYVEFTPYLDIFKRYGKVSLNIFVSLSTFNGRSQAVAQAVWSPYREYRLEVVDWEAEPVIGKKPLFEALQYKAYAQAHLLNLSLKTGRDNVKVGRALRYPLFLSGTSYPLDWIYLLEGDFGILKGYAGFSRICDTLPNRRLSFQRLELEAGPLSLAITEAVVYARSDSWKYANPFVLYYVVQRIETPDNDDNLFLHLDASLRIKDFEIYGEFMGDDPSFFHGEGQAPLWGATAGIRYDGKLFVMLEFSTVSPFTYAHYTRINNLSVLGLPLANYLGQDYRATYVRVGKGKIFGEYEYILHGSTPFGLAYENSGLPPDRPFPTAPTNTWHRLGIGFIGERGTQLKRWELNGKVGLRVGFDIIDGKFHPSYTLLWGGAFQMHHP
ncbi:MAG: hypothetical protein GXO39_02950 [Thermotogae bacterium]|nr:hypothetical protein [Thermotogota bacterium]